MTSADLRSPVVALIAGGASLAAVGALAWTLDASAVRVLAALAVVVGGYVALVGLGLGRARRATALADAARRDADRKAAQILAAAGELIPAGGDAGCAEEHICATCTKGCALASPRRA